MNYKQALNKSRLKRLIGFIILSIGVISSVVSLLRMLYFNFNDGTAIGGALSKVFQKLVYLIYENTQFLNIFWENCPTPNLNQLNTEDNIYFICLYILIFIGAALYSSGKKLAIRLNEINRIIEDQLIHESIRNGVMRTRQELENDTHINDSSIFAQVHQLYIAPLVITVIGGIVLKLSGF